MPELQQQCNVLIEPLHSPKPFLCFVFGVTTVHSVLNVEATKTVLCAQVVPMQSPKNSTVSQPLRVDM